jgi:hypothetical protein
MIEEFVAMDWGKEMIPNRLLLRIDVSPECNSPDNEQHDILLQTVPTKNDQLPTK